MRGAVELPGPVATSECRRQERFLVINILQTLRRSVSTAKDDTKVTAETSTFSAHWRQVPVAALDILHKLLVEDQVVVCKMNPVNAWAGPFIRCGLQSSISI